MQHFIRTHKKWILGIVIVLVSITFIFWGVGPGGMGRSRDEHRQGVTPLAIVAEKPILVEEYRRQLDATIQQQARFGMNRTIKDMVADGSAHKVLDDLITSKLLDEEAQKIALHFTRDYLEERLKEEAIFKNEETRQFDPQKWNTWIDEGNERGRNWKQLYATLEQGVRREVADKRIEASARVLDQDVRRDFEVKYTKIQVKYVAIEPKIEPTEEEIQAQYDRNPAAYEIPEQRRAEFVAVSLTPSCPALADDLVKKARAGEDFAALAKAHSTSPDKEQGGDMGWMTQSLTLPAHQKVLFDLKVNEVSDPVEGPGGYYIYKVEEERTSEVTGQRDVHARQIWLTASLTDQEREERKATAEAIAAKAKESGDLRAAAAASGCRVQTSGVFSTQSVGIENVPQEDAWSFRSQLSDLDNGEVSDVITGSRNLYVAKIVHVEPAVPQPLEKVRAQVVADAVESIKNSPEHAAEVKALAEKIAAQAKSLADIQTQFPELAAEIKESPEFSAADYDYRSGPPWNPRDIYDAIENKAPGAFVGPVTDWRGNPYFLELVKKTPPDETLWKEKWPEEEKTLRQAALATAQRKRSEDYRLALRDRAQEEDKLSVDRTVLTKVLGLEEPAPSGPANVQETPADTASEAPAELSAPPPPVGADEGPVD